MCRYKVTWHNAKQSLIIMEATITVTAAHPHLGVTLSTVGGGARIIECDAADLIAKAGLRRGDVITHVEGEKVAGHEGALLQMAKKPSFRLRYTPWPEEPEAAAAVARATRAVTHALLLAMPALLSLGSIDAPTRLTPVLGNIVMSIAMKQMHRSQAIWSARVFTAIGTFLFAFLAASMGQEVRRCVGDICNYPTMYGTEADCRAPCSTDFGKYLHWPAVAASIVAMGAAGRALHYTQTAVQAYEEFGRSPGERPKTA